jgi:hypothetical protein
MDAAVPLEVEPASAWLAPRLGAGPPQVITSSALVTMQSASMDVGERS